MQIKNLTMSFGTQVLFENINLNILENEKVGVVGVNGAGDCVTGVFCSLKSIEYDDEEALQTAVNIATESIKNYGMFHLVKKYNIK